MAEPGVLRCNRQMQTNDVKGGRKREELGMMYSSDEEAFEGGAPRKR